MTTSEPAKTPRTRTAKALDLQPEVVDVTPVEAAAETVAIAPANPGRPARPTIGHYPERSIRELNRPVSPSTVEVSHTVSLAGVRPVMADPRGTGDRNFSNSPRILNRPIASNDSDDTNSMLGYLD